MVAATDQPNGYIAATHGGRPHTLSLGFGERGLDAQSCEEDLYNAVTRDSQ